MNTSSWAPAPGRVLRAASGRASWLVDPRSVATGLGLLLVGAAVGVVALSVGDFPIAPVDTVRTLLGRGSATTDLVIFDLRLPRLLTALAAGAAFGASGAVFQSLTRNPLGSPDIIGFTAGASTGALMTLLVIGTGVVSVGFGAVAGAGVSAVVVYLLAYHRGAPGYRLVIIGIGVQAMLTAFNSYLLVRANIFTAQGAASWLVGSLNARDGEHVATAGFALAVLLPAALVLNRRCRMLEMGDEAARALGVSVERSRVALIGVGVGLAAAATAATGPIAFVALAAPQLARRVTRATGPGILPAALMGAVLLVASDVIAQHALGAVELPVGVVTSCLGGVYLVWLLGWGQHRRTGTRPMWRDRG